MQPQCRSAFNRLGWNAIDGFLQENFVEHETLARMKGPCGEGLGYLKIANALNAEGRATKRGALGGP